jgi:8-oxo-dGTP pyrophosphatase MutT (NUDIX family)
LDSAIIYILPALTALHPEDGFGRKNPPALKSRFFRIGPPIMDAAGVRRRMKKPHRIAAGGIIFRGNEVLLVRYQGPNPEGTYLVGPGGEAEDQENVVQTIIRETKEETGITVEPKRVMAIEDLDCTCYKMIKVWMLCEIVAGEIRKTEEAEIEGIIEAGWFARGRLSQEIVYPDVLQRYDWSQFRSESWRTVILPSRKAEM